MSQQRSTLPDVITNWQHEHFSYNGQEIRLTIPADPGELLEQLEQQPDVENEQSFDSYRGIFGSPRSRWRL